MNNINPFLLPRRGGPRPSHLKQQEQQGRTTLTSAGGAAIQSKGIESHQQGSGSSYRDAEASCEGDSDLSSARGHLDGNVTNATLILLLEEQYDTGGQMSKQRCSAKPALTGLLRAECLPTPGRTGRSRRRCGPVP